MQNVPLTTEDRKLILHAIGTMMQADHYLKNGTVADRKMANDLRDAANNLDLRIQRDLLRNQLGA